MPKYTIDQKAEMLKRAEESDKKSKRYAGSAEAYRAFESNQPYGFGPNYKAGKEAAKHLANMYESEAEDLRQRATPATNSREQYESEKEQGDPHALRMSYEEWKKL